MSQPRAQLETPEAETTLEAGATLEVEMLARLDALPAEAWDTLAGEADPFVEHGFLSLLERTGCVGPGTGWQPCHLVARRGARLVGAVPLYLKQHSFGEYIFDWGWAEASHAAGIDYYPKLVSAVPFTPATGRRLLLAPDLGAAEARAVREALVDAVSELARQADASSVHWLFVTEAEQRDLRRDHGLIPRLTHQFHWENQGYADFDDLLARFRSPARKNVRRERRQAHSHGLRLETRDGEQLEPRDWRALYRFYTDTGARKWGQPYLNREFFEGLREELAHRVVCTLARTPEGEPVAGTLNFEKGGRLYGRYWGRISRGTLAGELDGLHFELCYYRLLELCIARSWSHFEAGAQGTHKLKRGLLPVLTYSAHWLRHPALAEAVQRAVSREATHLRHELAALAAAGPFKRSPR